MKAIYSGTVESIKVELQEVSRKLEMVLEQRELLQRAMIAIEEANRLATANNGSRPNQLGQQNIFVIFKATGILDLIYENFGENAAETGRILELITGYTSDEYARIIGRGEVTPTKLDPDSAENAFEQLAEHLERNKGKKVARAVRALGRSPR
jgi:hypothetical protein